MFSEQSCQVTLYPQKLQNSCSYIPQYKKKKKIKGKILQIPIINAYNRKNLGAIPSTIENILHKRNNGDIIRFSFNVNEVNENEDKIKKQKYEKGIFTHKLNIRHLMLSPRFNYSEIEKEKYLPGPGQYYNNNSTLNKEGNFRYKGIFNYGREEIPLNFSDNDNNNIGPGKYNINSIKSNRNIYISPINRFKKTKLEFYKKILGPGAYDVNLNIGTKYKNNIKSSFFKNNFISRNQIINKKSENIPGPGTYELRRPLLIKNQSFDKIKSFRDIKNEIIKKMNLKNKENKLNDNVDNSNNVIEDNKIENVKKLKGFTMEKNIPRFVFPGKKNDQSPGPGYYSPILNSKHNEFNINEDNKWMI